jgi:hypothetical protein
MTAKQAAALGIIPKQKTRTTRKTAKGPYHTVCVACGEEFHTLASEDRHLNTTKHGNYRLVLGY